MSERDDAGHAGDPGGEWRAFTAAIRGAVHDALGMPLQDAVTTTAERAGLRERFVVAVADGHGDKRHHRSAQGAHFAVNCAATEGTALAGRIAELESSGEVVTALAERFVPALVESWRAAVRADVNENPLTEEELEQAFGDATIAYGSTVLTAVFAHPWLALAQVGDGNVVVAMPDGTVDEPVPIDPSLDGRQTTSLCQIDAVEAFRVAVLDLTEHAPAIVLLATDGFANSQIHDDWPQLVGTDLRQWAAEQGPEWLGSQLPQWAARCASGEGSGDDTSLALVLQDPFEMPAGVRAVRAAPRGTARRWRRRKAAS